MEQAGGRFTREECPYFYETHKTFYELMRYQLYKHYTESQSELDRQYYIDSTRFGKDLDDYIDELSTGRYLTDLHPDAFDLYKSAEDMIVEKCFSIYWSNGTRCGKDQPADGCQLSEYAQVFRGHVEAVVQEQRDLLEKTGVMDSVLVKVN